MKKRTLSFLLLSLSILQIGIAQQAIPKQKITPEIQKTLKDSVQEWFFSPRTQITYDFSQYDTRPFHQLPDAPTYDSLFLKKCLKAIAKDSLNPYPHMELGNYYEANGSSHESYR